MLDATSGPLDGRFLVIGDTPLARRVCATLGAAGGQAHVVHLTAPSDAQLAVAVDSDVAHALVLVRDDVSALRYALATSHLAPALPLVVTVFDHTIATQLRALQPRARVVSPALAAVPSLVGPCLDGQVVAAFAERGDVLVLRRDDHNDFEEDRRALPRPSRAQVLSRRLTVNYRHLQPSGRILAQGLAGLAVVLVLDWSWLALVAGHPPVAALGEAVRVLATVGPGPEHPSGAYGLLSAFAMLATIVLTALFTAGLVDRFVEPRLVRLGGSGAVPRTGHVVVVGLGQVGVRLCQRLTEQAVAVVAVERDHDAAGVALARQLQIPVIIDDGTSRRLLERLRLDRCLAVAAVGSDDLDNVAVAVAASAVSPSVRVVMRAGEQEAVAETRSLLPLGITRDVTAIGAAHVLTLALRAREDVRVAGDGDAVHVRVGTGEWRELPLARRDECRHLVSAAPDSPHP
ncbi:NAD-binding protein [Kribbella sp. NPDC004875]|uniref:NAD-binding protein n=1 Tax=Kribbella sp. NPDC004875 TaxID=3364107 RepID=UPI00367EAEF6